MFASFTVNFTPKKNLDRNPNFVIPDVNSVLEICMDPPLRQERPNNSIKKERNRILFDVNACKSCNEVAIGHVICLGFRGISIPENDHNDFSCIIRGFMRS
jgi:hypothetical protein